MNFIVLRTACEANYTGGRGALSNTTVIGPDHQERRLETEPNARIFCRLNRHTSGWGLGGKLDRPAIRGRSAPAGRPQVRPEALRCGHQLPPPQVGILVLRCTYIILYLFFVSSSFHRDALFVFFFVARVPNKIARYIRT